MRIMHLDVADFPDDLELQQLLQAHKALLDAAILEVASYDDIQKNDGCRWLDDHAFPDVNNYFYDNFAREVNSYAKPHNIGILAKEE